MKTRVRMAGVGEDMRPVYAEHDGDQVTFAMDLAGGRAAVVTAPKLTQDQARRWLKARLGRFGAHPEARESAEEAVRRKALAAQGASFVRLLSAKSTADERAELRMMFSPDSHSQGEDLDEIRGQRPVALRVDVAGKVSGLPDPDLRDTEGRELKPA